MAFCQRKEPVTTVLGGLVEQKTDFQTTNLKFLINFFRRKNVACGSLGCYFNVFNTDCFV